MEKDWLEIRIVLPPDSGLPLRFNRIFRTLGFRTNINLVRDEHPDGSIIEYSPVPPPPR